MQWAYSLLQHWSYVSVGTPGLNRHTNYFRAVSLSMTTTGWMELLEMDIDTAAAGPQDSLGSTSIAGWSSWLTDPG